MSEYKLEYINLLYIGWKFVILIKNRYLRSFGRVSHIFAEKYFAPDKQDWWKKTSGASSSAGSAAAAATGGMYCRISVLLIS